MISAPESLDVALIPPEFDLGLFRDAGHFIKGFIEESHVGWIDDGTLQDGGILKHHISLDDMGVFELIENLFLDHRNPFSPEPFSKGREGGVMHTGFEGGVGDIAKILDIAVFFDLFDNLTIAELSQSGDEGDRDHGAQGLTRAPFLGVVEGDQAIDHGLPGDNVSQNDQFVGGIGYMGFDPLGTEGLLESLCYHDMNLFEGMR